MNAPEGLPCLPAPPAAATGPDIELARRHAPILQLDSAEPFRPVAVGVTIYSGPGKSVSSKFDITPEAGPVIEYAIYWDHDIQHLYDLEHVWIHLDWDGRVVRVDGSQHGRRLRLAAELEGDRVTLCPEPGKHALFAAPADLRTQAEAMGHMCGPAAGEGGIHTANLFGAAAFGDPAPASHRLARLYLKRRAFAPAFDAAIPLDLQGCALLPWTVLAAWIPRRMRALVARLPLQVPHLKGVFLDCGDTLVDEGTEVKEPGTGVVLSAALVEGAAEMLDILRSRGYPLVLVADGPRGTFENVLGHYGLWDHFGAHVISGDVGVTKPSPEMFETALAALGLPHGTAGHTVMVGNNLERDVKGANAFGIVSVFFDWSDRRRRMPISDDERPDHTIGNLAELPKLLDDIETGLPPLS